MAEYEPSHSPGGPSRGSLVPYSLRVRSQRQCAIESLEMNSNSIYMGTIRRPYDLQSISMLKSAQYGVVTPWNPHLY
jgi:hypothetical protein